MNAQNAGIPTNFNAKVNRCSSALQQDATIQSKGARDTDSRSSSRTADQLERRRGLQCKAEFCDTSAQS